MVFSKSGTITPLLIRIGQKVRIWVLRFYSPSGQLKWVLFILCQVFLGGKPLETSRNVFLSGHSLIFSEIKVFVCLFCFVVFVFCFVLSLLVQKSKALGSVDKPRVSMKAVHCGDGSSWFSWGFWRPNPLVIYKEKPEVIQWGETDNLAKLCCLVKVIAWFGWLVKKQVLPFWTVAPN